MPDQRDRVLRYLHREEPNYGRAAAKLGPEVIPELLAIVREAEEPLLASKATYLASLIDSPDAWRVVEAAADHPAAEVRVAAAAAVGNLPPASHPAALEDEAGGGVLEQLLKDKDPGVRNYAVKSAAGMQRWERVQAAANDDDEDFVRETARDQLKRGRKP